MWLFELFFLNSENLIGRGTDISKHLRESLEIRDNESRLYFGILYSYETIQTTPSRNVRKKKLGWITIT